jgi:hypothetical protein
VAGEGDGVGKVHRVLGDPESDIFDGLAVGAGSVLDRPLYVPSEQVGEIEEGTVHLTIEAEKYRSSPPYGEPPQGQRLLAP